MAQHFELREELARERRLVSKKWPSLPIYIAGKITSGDGDDRNRIPRYYHLHCAAALFLVYLVSLNRQGYMSSSINGRNTSADCWS
jgi:hypothetical protein